MKAIFADAAWRQNPAWVRLLGLCPLLAVTTTIENALGLAAASAFVLLGSAGVVSLIRAFVPAEVRLPFFVLVIATFTSAVTMLMQAYAFDLYERVALFVQIIVTNCMILGRLEQFASKQPVGRALMDALGTACGFAVALVALGTAREFAALAVPLAALAPGAFIIAGLLLAGVRAGGDLAGRRLHRRTDQVHP
ncbi:MAG: electron transport complex subunit RsxE [Gammaproteobacteria bacterium]|nr:electron transport complex subunit RsxE [Gammaproteobacteria bacterium]